MRPDGGKGGQSSLLVDTVNGQKLKEPLGIPVMGVELPAGERCVLNGYESGRFIGVPDEVLRVEKMGGRRRRCGSSTAISSSRRSRPRRG